MISFKRWLKAQEYEKSFWEKTANHIVSGISGIAYSAEIGRLFRSKAATCSD
jgi:hypothetical protein